MPNAAPPPRTPADPPALAVLIVVTAVSTLSLNMALPSLPAIGGDFGAAPGLVGLVVSGYLAATAMLQLILGPLSDRYGRRPVLLAGMAVFVLASIGCALAGDIGTLLAFRMLQAVVIAGYAVSLAVVRDIASGDRAAALIGHIASAMALAPMLGPMLGGVLQETVGWRGVFGAYATAGAIALTLVWSRLAETNRHRAASFGAQARAYPALLGAPLFWAHALCMALSTSAFYAFLSAAPFVATERFGLSASAVGLAIGSITAGYVAGSFTAARTVEKLGAGRVILAGRCVACGGLGLGLAAVLGGLDAPFVVFGATLCVGIGNGLTVPASSAAAVSVRPDLAGSAAGLAGALTVGVGAVWSGTTGVLIGLPDPVSVMLAAMLTASAGGLLAALAARRLAASRPAETA